MYIQMCMLATTKLNRYHFISRLVLERHMLMTFYQALMFLPLTCLLLHTCITYAPLTAISDLHQTIATRFDLQKLIDVDHHVTSRPEFYTWMDSVIKQTYRHAQV